MSVHLSALVWEIEFPTSTQKLLLLRVADYADDDGAGIYPSIAEVARQIGASERQIQYAIRAFEGVKILDRVKDGGTGPTRTNVWRINVDLLGQLALQEMKLVGSHDCLQAVDNEGAIIAPRTLLRVQSRLLRVQSATDKGAMGRTQSLSKNHQLEPSSAGERACETSASAPPALKKPVTIFHLTPSDAQWSHWLTWLTDRDRRDLAIAAEEARRMTVTGSNWPLDDSALPRIDLSETISKRRTGDAA